MARLSHPNVVTVYDVGVADDGRVFLAMEIVDGGTLGAWLKEHKRSWREVVEILCEAGEGLAAAHRAGMIHRDFKLDNVLIGGDGRPRVTDFGLARAVGDDTSSPRVRTRSPMTDDSSLVADAVESAHDDGLAPRHARLHGPGAVRRERGYRRARRRLRLLRDALPGALRRAAVPGRDRRGDRDATLNGRVGVGAERQRRACVAAARPAARPLGGLPRPPCLDGGAARGAARGPGQAAPALGGCGRGRDGCMRRRRRAACGRTAEGSGVPGRGRPVREVWDVRKKDVIRRAFLATGVSYAGDTWSKVERALDGYADAWSGASEQACVATRIRGEQSEAMLELQTACLNLRLDELRALGRVLAGADAKTVENAVQAARSLSPLETCSNVDRLGAATRLPRDVASRAEIHALESEIANAKELNAAGRSLESLERLRSVRERVFDTRHAPLMVSWRLEEANAERDSGDSKAAVADYEEVAALADSDKLDLERAAALVRRGEMERPLRSVRRRPFPDACGRRGARTGRRRRGARGPSRRPGGVDIRRRGEAPAGVAAVRARPRPRPGGADRRRPQHREGALGSGGRPRRPGAIRRGPRSRGRDPCVQSAKPTVRSIPGWPSS